MAADENVRCKTLNADATVGVFTGPPGVAGSASPNSGTQYKACKYVGANKVGLCTSATDRLEGIIYNKPQATGAAVTVAYQGRVLVRVGAAVTDGDKIAPDSTGRFVTDGTNGRLIARQSATVADQVIAADFPVI